MKLDILVHNGTVITVDPDFRIIEDGEVWIKGGKLERVGVASARKPDAAEIVDAGGGIIMPGLVNTHTHLPMTLFRGLADDLPLNEWLNEHIFPAEARHMNPDAVRLGTLLGCAEMLLSGTTTCCDGYFFEDRVAEAVARAGMRAVLGQGVIDFPAPGVPDPADNVRNAVRFVEKWRDASRLIRPSIFCHAPYTCSADTLQKAKGAAVSMGVLFQIHAAETRSEYDRFRSEKRMSPVKYLDAVGILDPDTLLVHAVWLDADDVEIIARRKAGVSHNPESNMKLASGVAPVPALLKAGVTVGLGTDGCASNNDLDLFREMDTAAKLHKVNVSDPTATDAATVLKMATIDAAAVLGLNAHIGSLETGKQADLIVIDTRKPHLFPLYNPVSQIVYASRGSDVKDVIVGGSVLVRNRELKTIDVADVLARAADFAWTVTST